MPKSFPSWLGLQVALLICLLCQSTRGAPADSKIETIVLIRHAEKPPEEFGQLACQGLNRALELPSVLINKFGKPNAIFAPNPSGKVPEEGNAEYNYIRPLMTIEPTAIRLGMPVNCDFLADNIAGLEQELLKPNHAGQLIFVAWEHKKLNKMVKELMKTCGGDPDQVPHWDGDDFDRIYVLRIDTAAKSITFTQDKENLNNLSTECPLAK
jgi:hypothetical protein